MERKIFLCHSSIDKPFVEKLAKDLTHLGIDVWFDKYEIKVGDSILMKIEDGITTSGYLAVVLSPESLQSAWVKHELESAFVRFMKEDNFKILPILYRNCELPLFLAGKKYADFTHAYEKGLQDLADVFQIRDLQVCDATNWRRFASKKNGNWEQYREQEFRTFTTEMFPFCFRHNIGMKKGNSKNPYALHFHVDYTDDMTGHREHDVKYLGVRLSGTDHKYYLAYTEIYNPNHMKAKDYTMVLGSTMQEAKEQLMTYLMNIIEVCGKPYRSRWMYDVRCYMNEEKTQNVIQAIHSEMFYFDGDFMKTLYDLYDQYEDESCLTAGELIL